MSKNDGDNVSLDSAYGSDSESMAVPRISGLATQVISDIDRLIGRLGTYKETFNVKTYADEILQFNEASMSVIEGLAAENFRKSLSDDKIQQLVDAIALNSELCSKFISTDKQELGKLKLNVAKTEGALKGFVLPLKALSGPANYLTNFRLDREEYEIPMEATKKALLELQGQKLTKLEYADRVVAKTIEILKQDEQKFSAEKLQQFENFVRQGNTSLKVKNDKLIIRDNKLSRLSQFDLEEISNAAIKSVDAFIKELEIGNENATNTSPEKGREIIPKSMSQQDSSQKVSFGEQKTKDLQAAKEMVSSTIDESIKQLKLKVHTNTADKIKKNLSQVLGKFDPQFLQENRTAIITNITHQITQQGKTVFSKLKKEVHIAKDKVEKIAQKITKEYGKQNNQFIEERINPLRNENKAELALRLSTFIQENPLLPDTINSILELSEENKITGDTKSLNLTDKQVEHITLEQLKTLKQFNPVGFNRNLFQEIPAEVKSINVETEKVQQHSFEMGQRQQLEDEGYVSMDENIQQPEKNILPQNIVQQEQQNVAQQVQRQDITEQVPQEVTNISADNINKQFSEQQEIPSKIAEVLEEAVVEKSTASKEQFPIEINPEMTNVELAKTLSNFIENNAVTVDHMRIILGTEPSLQDGKIQLTAEQAASITGEQWQWFRDVAPTNFEKEFKGEREVQVNNSVEVEKSTGLWFSDNVKERVLLGKQIIRKAIKLVEEGGKQKLDYTQRSKIIDKLSDKLSELDADYLKTEEQAIAETIAKNIKKDASKSLFSNKITVSDKILTKYADGIEKFDSAKSNKFAAKKINEGIYNHQLKDSQIAEKLSQFLTTIFDPEHELVKKITSYKPSEHTTENIVGIRKLNPRLFDEIMFPKERLTEIAQNKVTSKARFDELTKEGNSSRDSKSFATDILVDVINSVKQKEGALRISLKPKEKEKIFSILHSSLSSLDPQYLNVNRQKITGYITANIVFSGKNEGKDKVFTIAKETLDKIAARVMVAHESKSNEFAAGELKKGSMEISEKLVAHQVTNSLLKERVSKLLATGNIKEAANRLGVFNDKKTVDLKNITDKQLTALKRINPKKFDEIVFPESDIAKIATKKQEQKQKLFSGIDLKEVDFRGITMKHITGSDDKIVPKITTVKNKAKGTQSHQTIYNR